MNAIWFITSSITPVLVALRHTLVRARATESKRAKGRDASELRTAAALREMF